MVELNVFFSLLFSHPYPSSRLRCATWLHLPKPLSAAPGSCNAWCSSLTFSAPASPWNGGGGGRVRTHSHPPRRQGGGGWRAGRKIPQGGQRAGGWLRRTRGGGRLFLALRRQAAILQLLPHPALPL